MGQGLQVFNDSNLVQIDGTTPNLVLIAKGAAYESVTIASPNYPLFFIRPAQGYRFWFKANGNGTYTYSCNGYFEYWAFSNKVDDGTQNFGLQVFGESGQLLYGSDSKPLKPNRFIQLAINTAQPPPIQGYSGGFLPTAAGSNYPTRIGTLASYTSMPHNNFAFNFSDIAGTAALAYSAPGITVWWVLGMSPRVVNGGFIVDEYMLQQVRGPGGYVFPFKANPTILAVDVTNL